MTGKLNYAKISGFLSGCLMIAAFLWIIALPNQAHSDQAQKERYVYVGVDRAKLIRMDEEPGTVIIGNPSVASILVQPNNILVLQGKGYGKTNAIILDKSGKTIDTMLLSVVDNEHSASVYAAGSRRSYVCTEASCQIELRIGDNGDYFQGVAEQRQGKDGLATSQ